ncbi:MAG: hypothetical protein EA350_08165 [Gemmatimonadales bacterium]|nr:MAG: hypothetical protein EA350_08165 [Gemmatimonadales bacterium]
MSFRVLYFVCLCLLASACTPEPRVEGEAPEDTAGSADSTDEILRGAREVLVEYLGHIRGGRHEAALALYGGDPDAFPRQAWFGTDTLSAEQFLRAACADRILFCDLGVRSVVEARLIGTDTVRVAVELENGDGTRFEAPAAGGQPGPADTLFEFDVLARNGTFSVLSLPVYRP